MLDKLMRKGKILVNGCYLCKQDAESCNHALWWSLFVSALLFGLLFIGSELGYCWIREGGALGLERHPRG